MGTNVSGLMNHHCIYAGVKLSARPLAMATICLVWAHEIIKAFAHLATVNLLSCKHFISSFNRNTLKLDLCDKYNPQIN